MLKTDKLIKHLKVSSLPVSSLKTYFDQVYFNSDDEVLEYLVSTGFPLVYNEDETVSLKTLKSYEDEIFCIVDIETNGAKKTDDLKIIEIGAIKVKNFQIIDKFESFLQADYIKDYVSKITGITLNDTLNAPKPQDVFMQFRLFLQDSIFVAHNVSFDFNTIAKKFQQFNLGELNNQKLCTLDLSRRTIVAPRYGLAFLREHLNIDHGVHHRAYDDAISSYEVLKECLKNLPQEVKTTQQLIEFSKAGKKILK